MLRYLDFDLGIRVDAPPVPFVSLKWAREIPFGKWSLFPLAKLFAETEQGVGLAAGETASTVDQYEAGIFYRRPT